jgi:hypothetical protein
MWGRKGTRFELAVEAAIPEEHQTPLASPDYDTIRYEMALGLDGKTQQFRILEEELLLGHSQRMSYAAGASTRRALPTTVFKGRASDGWRRSIRWKILKEGKHKVDSVESPSLSAGEVGSHWMLVSPDPRRPILENLPEDEFPAATWLARMLRRGVFHIELQNAKLRQPSPPGKGRFLLPDGSNLPWVVSTLEKEAPQQYSDWQAHLRTALPDLQGIRVVERAEDKHRYLMLQYPGDLDVPSWMLSDGTLRLLALTIIPYIPDFRPICLIEEPENSMHPLNVETVMQSLQSVYQGQVLVATHSPLLLAVVEPKAVLVFSRDEERGTTIIPGDQHPGLENWRGEVSLGTLFAGGVLS